MKTTLSLLLIAFGFSTFSQTTLIPDTEFEIALISFGIDSDGMVNGEVLTADVASVTELDISWMLISDLTGIEDFASLEDLNCSFMLLTSLDVSTNTNLTELRFSGNSIPSIDVTSLADLITLDLVGNFISELDLSQNLVLETLWALDNDLTELDVSLNIELIILGCWENEIVRLDVSNNPNLNEFWCHDNALTYLRMDNGNNISITDFSALDNPDLYCIHSDDSTYSTLNFTNIDDQSYFGVDCYLGVQKNDIPLHEIYPNPAKDFLTIRTTQAAPYTLTSISGSIAHEGSLLLDLNQVDLSHLENGIYILTIQYPNANAISKLVIEN